MCWSRSVAGSTMPARQQIRSVAWATIASGSCCPIAPMNSVAVAAAKMFAALDGAPTVMRRGRASAAASIAPRRSVIKVRPRTGHHPCRGSPCRHPASRPQPPGAYRSSEDHRERERRCAEVDEAVQPALRQDHDLAPAGRLCAALRRAGCRCARRFQHRPHLAAAPAEACGRRGQDRPLVHPLHHQQP